MVEGFLFLILNLSWAQESRKIAVEEVTLRGVTYQLEFRGHSDFCLYDEIVVRKGPVELASFPKRCGRVARPQENVSKNLGHRFSRVIRLGKTEETERIYFSEETAPKRSQMMLMSLQGPPKIVWTQEPDGEFRDFNGDGRLDLLKEGGHGEKKKKGLTYDPYLVFRQAKDQSFVLDEKLSKRWSRKNKYKWRGTAADSSFILDEKGDLVKD